MIKDCPYKANGKGLDYILGPVEFAEQTIYNSNNHKINGSKKQGHSQILF